MACRDQLDAEKMALVFQARPDIVEGIQTAADTPTTAALFNAIVDFVLERLSDAADSEEPASKRRRVNGTAGGHTNGTVPVPDDKTANGAGTAGDAAAPAAGLAETAAQEELQLEVKDISVSVPQRKKLNLCFTKNYLYARTNADTKPVAGVVYRWADIEHAFYVPVPEKAQQQWNYVLFPRGSYLPSSSSTTPPAPEPLVFTVPATAPKAGSISGRLAGQAQAVSDSHTSLFHWAVAEFLRIAHKYHSPSPDTTSPVPLVCADPKVFHSAVRQSHRPAEKAVHVRAFRGSKDGYLFFLPTGVLWGFKKPLLFLPLDRVVALSYTSVLQRTFNMVVEVDLGADGATEELEFSMLDQEDYAGISQNYVAKHRLQDRSMAEQRKAKRELAENAKKGGAGEGGGDDGGEGAGGDGAPDGDDGLTELERAEKEAEQRLQDEEDEDEEDYDPGSDGDSEGEGSSSEDDDDNSGGEGEGDEDEDEDLPDADE